MKNITMSFEVYEEEMKENYDLGKVSCYNKVARYFDMTDTDLRAEAVSTIVEHGILSSKSKILNNILKLRGVYPVTPEELERKEF